MARAGTLVALLTLASGCSLIVEDGVRDLMTSDNSKRDVRLTMLDMDPHLGQFLDFQIIRPPVLGDPTSFPQLEARAIIDPLPVACFELVWPLGASLGATRLDFYADLDRDGVLGAPGDDHVWRREISTLSDGTGTHRFLHDVMFDDIRTSLAVATGVDLEVTLTGIDAQDGRLAVVAVIRDFRETVDLPFQESVPGIGVVGAIDGGIMDLTIPGLLDAGEIYEVEIDFGQGMMTCRRELMAPTSGPLVIDSLDAFDCTVTDRHEVFLDISDTSCR